MRDPKEDGQELAFLLRISNEVFKPLRRSSGEAERRDHSLETFEQLQIF